MRAARSEAVHAALDHATAATAEAEGHVAELRAKGPEKAGASAMIPSAMSAGDAAMCSESGSAGTLSASGPHQAVPPARRRRRGGGVEHRHVRGSHGDDAEGGQGDGAVLQWQCQVTRPGRVMPHPVSLTLSDSGLLLQVRSCSVQRAVLVTTHPVMRWPEILCRVGLVLGLCGVVFLMLSPWIGWLGWLVVLTWGMASRTGYNLV